MTIRALSRCLLLVCPLALSAGSAAAQPAAAAIAPEPFAITDNSFLVEEAFNQETGIFQNIVTWTSDADGAWESTFTQEWPAPGIRHQLSYTIPVAGDDSLGAHIGGVLVNYRYQVLEEGIRRPALSPRVSVILPTGRREDASDRPGLQFNVPISKQYGNFYLHGNAGVTWLHAVPSDREAHVNLTSPQVAASVVWRTKPMLNLMVEGVLASEDGIDERARRRREASATVSPGLRGGWNAGEKQLILGLAVPVTRRSGDTSVGLLTYLSYELPFSRSRSGQ
jgi:hypothetical protein